MQAHSMIPLLPQLPAEQLDSPIEEAAISDRTTAVKIEGISKSFGGRNVLRAVTLEVVQGELLVLLGASGSGKTTLLRILAGLEEPDNGRVILHDQDATGLPARARNIGIITQNYLLFPRMTVRQNIGYGLKIRGRSKAEISNTVERLIALVKLQEHCDKRPAQLSGGQQQRVAIARALAYNPQVLLFDEAFGALDLQTRSYLRGEITGLLKQLNVSAIFITHDQEEAIEVGDRIAVLHDGVVEQVGAPAEVYNRPTTEYVANFMGTANILPGLVWRGAVVIGSTVIPSYDETRELKEGQSVKLVFRPEDAQITSSLFFAGGGTPLAKGVVESIKITGANERLRVRLHLGPVGYEESVDVQPEKSGSRGEGSTIIVTRSKIEASNVPLTPGNRVVVGLRNFMVLAG